MRQFFRRPGSPHAFLYDADIRSFFDEVSQDWLVKFLNHRIGDPRIADPVSWQFVYNHAAKKTNSGLTASTTQDPIAENVKALISSGLPDFQEYSPSLFSDYNIRIIDLLEKNGRRKRP